MEHELEHVDKYGSVGIMTVRTGMTWTLPDGSRITLRTCNGAAAPSTNAYDINRMANALERLAQYQFEQTSFAEQLGYWKAKAELLERSHEALSAKLASLQNQQCGGEDRSSQAS